MNTLRAFVAIELPDEILRQMELVQSRLKATAPPRNVRWVHVQGIHLTLKFLGQVPTSQVDGISRAMSAAAQSIAPFTVTVGGVGCFPSTKLPRVVWIGVSEPTGGLNSLQHALEAAISPLGYPPEDRRFQPHLTLGRTARDAPPDDVRRLGQVVAAADVGTLGQVAVGEIALIKSDLKPTGAEYTALQRARLKT